MMKNILYSLVLFSFVSCSVDRFPEDRISDETFWRSERDLKSAANYLYTFLPKMPYKENAWSDDASAILPNDVSDGSRLVPVTSAEYNDPYKLIRAANNIIEKAPGAANYGVGENTINIYISESRFFRAFAYFDLLQKYGKVPLILKVLASNASELTDAPAEREAILDAIYADLDFAAANLPKPTTLGNAGYGRISNTAANALKARVGLFEGTRAKFHQYGTPEKHLNIALNASKAVMESNEHSLFANYFNLFQLAGEGRQNRENILVRQYGLNRDNAVIFYNGANILESTALNSPTKSLADSYLMKDGLPTDVSPLYVTPTTTLEVFANRDERMGATMMKRGDANYRIDIPLFTIPNLSIQRTGFTPRKFVNANDYAAARTFIDMPIIRYAEVLLIFAEASFELNGSISDADLNKSINLLRARAKIANLTNTFVTDNGLDMRNEIRRERRVELAMEGQRYWDLIRWKTAEVELKKAVLGNYLFDEFGTSINVTLTPEHFILVHPADKRSFRVDRDYLWPFPVQEVALNPNLAQNPNW